MKNTPVTEAHRQLAQSINKRWCSYDDAAQLIADSEASSAEPFRATIRCLEANELTAAAELDECLAAWIAERDQLRAEVERLEARISNQAYRIRCLEGATNHATGTPLSQAIARAELAEAELAGIRALADRRNERDHSQDTTHQLVAALDQALDIAQAELADLKANNRFQRGHSAGYAEAKADCQSELAVERAIVSRIWVQLGSPTYEQLKGRSIYDLIDELKAELAAERARLNWLMAGGVCMVQHTGGFHVSRLHAPVSRAAIDAAMKEGA